MFPISWERDEIESTWWVTLGGWHVHGWRETKQTSVREVKTNSFGKVPSHQTSTDKLASSFWTLRQGENEESRERPSFVRHAPCRCVLKQTLCSSKPDGGGGVKDWGYGGVKRGQQFANFQQFFILLTWAIPTVIWSLGCQLQDAEHYLKTHQGQR